MEQRAMPSWLKQGMGKYLTDAMRSDLVPKAVPEEEYHTIHFRLFHNKKPVSRAKLSWFSKKDKSLETYGPRQTDVNGRGMVCISESVLHDLNSLQLVVTLGKENIIFKGFRVKKSSTVTLRSTKSAYLEIAGSSELPSIDKPEARRRKRFIIAVSGKSAQLRVAIPFLKKCSCFRLRKVFVDGELNSEISFLCKNISVNKVTGSLPRLIGGMDVLFDLSGNIIIQKLIVDQVKGKKKVKTIIFGDFDKFLGKEDQLLSYFGAE